MSDISGFDWWFRDRDYVLRERLAEVETQAYAASARSSARLSSQLSRLQGSLEGRLNALSAAFDAYVELGDIREQLAAFSESAAVRRESLAAIAALGDGRPAKPVDDRGTGSWIAPAINAMIARMTGTPDEAAEAQARDLDPTAELFIIAAAGILGRGPEVAARVPALLQPAAELLDDHQQVLFRAVVAGIYGDGLLPVLLLDWAGRIDHDGAAWWTWAQQRAAADGRITLDWIEQIATTTPTTGDDGATSAPPIGTGPSDPASGTAPPGAPEMTAGPDHDQQPIFAPADDGPPAPAPDSAAGALRQVVFGLIDAGQGEERELLARARLLRARIENPTADDDPVAHGDSATAAPGVSVRDAVCTSFLDAEPGTRAWLELRTAIIPGLQAAVDSETPGILSQEPNTVIVRVAGRSVPVTAQGPDRQALAEAQRRPPIADPAYGNSRLYGFGGGAAAAVVLALVLAIAGVSALLVVLLLIVGVVLGILAARVLLGRRQEQQLHQQQQQADQAKIDEAVRSAQASDASRQDAVRQSSAQLDRIRTALAAAG